MQLHYRAPDSWQNANESAAQELQLDLERQAAQIYYGVGHALVEVSIGLSKLYPLKKKIYYFKGLSPYFEEAVLPLAKEGYKVIALGEDIFSAPEEWAQKIEREDLFVLYPADEPILGRLYDIEKFESALKEKSIVKIRVSHARHFYEQHSTPVDKFSVNIYSLSADRALAVLGERCRLGSLVANQLQFDQPPALSWFRNPTELNKNKIIEFESLKVAGATPFFKPDSLRVYDRAVIYWTNIDGHAFIDRLDKIYAGKIESTSASRQSSVQLMNYLSAHHVTSAMCRGMILVSHECIDPQGQLIESIRKIHQSIINDQGGV